MEDFLVYLGVPFDSPEVAVLSPDLLSKLLSPGLARFSHRTEMVLEALVCFRGLSPGAAIRHSPSLPDIIIVAAVFCQIYERTYCQRQLLRQACACGLTSPCVS